MIKNLSVFFPAYNEEKNIENTVKVALKVLKNLHLENYEIIVVNDGSSDNTAQIVRKLAREDEQVRLVSHDTNQGYGNTLKTGFKEAKYEWVAFTDSDGQFDFSEIDKFLTKVDQFEVILGYRKNRADSFLRRLFTFGWKTLVAILFGLFVKDYSCGFKLIKREVYAAVQPLDAGEKVTQIEMLVKAKKAGFKFAEVGVDHYPRQFGTQTGDNPKVVFKSLIDLLRLWWRFQNKMAFLILVAILGLAAFLRFYRLPEYMAFLGDEGRDALMVKRILVDHDFPLLGPPTSIGNIYLGPLYYYMMAVPMAIFWLNPVAAAAQVAAIGVATVGLIYYLAKSWFNQWAGLISAFLYAISPVTIIYARSSWNPNPTPFFAILCILGVYKSYKSGNFLWFILTGVSLAFAIQMHYLALILLPIMVMLWFLGAFVIHPEDVHRRHLIKGTLGAILAFVILMLPLLIFDLKYNFLNYRAIREFFLSRETTVNLNPLNSLERIGPIYSHDLIGRYVSGEHPLMTSVVAMLVVLPLIWALWILFKHKKQPPWPYLTLVIWLTMGILGLSLYKQTIYDHYLGFLNPVPYLLLGALAAIRISTSNVRRYLWAIGLGVLVISLAVVNLQKSPLKNPPNMQLQRTQEVAKFVINEIEGKPFNFALIAKNNYDAAYQFYLDIYGHKPKKVPFDITDQLFVVCEDSVCQPVGHPKQEISHFGMSRVEKESNFLGVKVFKLVHNPSGKP